MGIEILEAAFRNSAENADRLVRSSGSYIIGGPSTGPAVMQMLMGADWSEITDEVVMQQASFGKCRYFLAPIKDGQGVVSVTSIDGLFKAATGMNIDDWDRDSQGEKRDSAAKAGQKILDSLRLVWGAHGPEIQTNLDSVEVDFMVVCIGHPTNPEAEVDHTALVYTWHPGMPVAPARISSATIKLG